MTHYPPIQWRPVRRNAAPDEHLRRLERRCHESGGDACLAWLRARRRVGDEPTQLEWWHARQQGSDLRDAFAATLEELNWHRRDHQEQLRADIQSRMNEIDEAEMAALRTIHPRVRRSRRRDLYSLREWAERVAQEEGIFIGGRGGISEEFDQRRRVLSEEVARINEAYEARRDELKQLRDSLVWRAEPEHGDHELQYAWHTPYTYSTGTDPVYNAGRAARGDLVWLASQGFPGRVEHEVGAPSREVGYPHRMRARWRDGEGFRTYTQAASPLDVEILKWRERAWKKWSVDRARRSRIKLAGRSSDPNDHFESVVWDRVSDRPFTVETMRAKVKREGPLRPSWLS